MSLLSSKTSLKSLKYSDFIQSQKLESPTDLKAFSNTDASVGQHRSPDTKSGLGLQVEKRKEDVIRLGKATVNNPQAIKFQTNQTLLNQSVAINDILRGNKPDTKQAAIGLARVAGVTASAIAQAAGSGTGLRVIQGFVPLNGGYVVDKGGGSLLGAAVASLNPFGTENQISKANIALGGKTINDGFIGTEFEEAKSVSETRTNSTAVRRPKDRTQEPSYIGKRATPAIDGDKGPGKFVNRTTAVDKVTRKGGIPAGTKSLESRFYVNGTTSERDQINFLNISTSEIAKEDQDIIPFTIQNIPATGNTEFLYFRAYLDSLSDSYNGEWSGTRYIGRAEELYNYTGFKRGLQFSFKIAAHSPQELKPLYEKLNRLAGTTAPTYQNGLFMQGVFSKITIGDYVQKLPGFFTSVDLTWQTAYPWEIGDVDTGGRDNDTPRVPHILDVSVSFQPVHDFAPQYGQNFIVNTAAS